MGDQNEGATALAEKGAEPKKAEGKKAEKQEAAGKPLTLRQLLTNQKKLDSEIRIAAFSINTGLGVAVSVPECGRRDAEGDFQVTSQLGQLQLNAEGMKLLLDLKGNPDESVVTTLKKFFRVQLDKSLDEPVQAQQVAPQQ